MHSISGRRIQGELDINKELEGESLSATWTERFPGHADKFSLPLRDVCLEHEKRRRNS